MANMRQAGTDRGRMGETGEKNPKGVTASDTSGERKTSVPRQDSTKGQPGETGERSPKAKASDSSGERHERMEGGVGMGQRDKLEGREASHAGKHDGNVGEHNTGSQGEGHFYKHQKHEYK